MLVCLILSPLLKEILAKNILLLQMTEVVGEFLEEQLKEDALVASVLMVHSLNKSEQRRIALETIGKYVDNLISNPQEEKFRRIRISNKAFQVQIFVYCCIKNASRNKRLRCKL